MDGWPGESFGNSGIRHLMKEIGYDDHEIVECCCERCELLNSVAMFLARYSKSTGIQLGSSL